MFKKYFITGLVILLPLALTIAIIGWLIDLLTAPFVHIVTSFFVKLGIFSHGFLSQEQVVRFVSQLLILALIFFVVIGLGMAARKLFIASLLNFGDRLLHRIPIVNTVYKTTKDIIKTLFASDTKTFRQVVMVAFPHEGVYALGLVAREAPESCSQILKEELISVLIPTTPNPTCGFLMFYKKEDLIYLDMKTEDAIKFIISCGIIVPQDPKAESKPFTPKSDA
jgi:uncharacterized membrane protein